MTLQRQEITKPGELTAADIARLAAAARQPCYIVKQARDLNRRGVMWQRWGYYSKSEPLLARAKGLMRVARCRRELLQRTVAT